MSVDDFLTYLGSHRSTTELAHLLGDLVGRRTAPIPVPVTAARRSVQP